LVGCGVDSLLVTGEIRDLSSCFASSRAGDRAVSEVFLSDLLFPNASASSSSCIGLISVYAPGPMNMSPSGWNQKLEPSSFGVDRVAEVGTSSFFLGLEPLSLVVFFLFNCC